MSVMDFVLEFERLRDEELEIEDLVGRGLHIT